MGGAHSMHGRYINVYKISVGKLEGNRVGFEVLTAVSMKIAIFWVVDQTTRCYNPEDSNLLEGNRPLRRNRCRWEDDIKLYLKEI
jgi:hypothetical protein